MEREYRGKSVYRGLTIGPIAVLKKNDVQVKREKIEDAKQEIERVKQAVADSQAQLQHLYDKAVKEVGEASAAIFEVHQMMLEDEDYQDAIQNMIQTELVNAEYAVAVTGDNFAEIFASMDDEYMQARSADVKDISNRLVQNLRGDVSVDLSEMEPSIIVADDLSPSETVQMDKEKILGFVTRYGTINSHTAVLARTKGIPSVIGLGESLKKEYEGKTIIIDGFEGKVYIEPDYTTISKMKQKQDENHTQVQNLERLKGKENITQSGQKIDVCANIGTREDIENVLRSDAGGIGLFRSEFLYIENGTKLPTEEQQFQVYRLAAEAMGTKKVVIRTADLGGEKQAECLELGEDRNPEIGYRGIRVSLDKDEIFKTQLRAILRASAYGNMSVMFPMITDVEEVKQAKLILEKIKNELKDEKIPFNEEIKIGVMIETPAAVMISGELAREADFFSIGTNDLTQLTLGMDRTNSRLERFYNTHHPALLKMIRIIANNIHLEGKKIALCGDLAADLSLTEKFIQMGIDELSVAPNQVLALRKKIREIQ